MQKKNFLTVVFILFFLLLIVVVGGFLYILKSPPHAGSCKILEEKYCNSGEKATYDLNGTTYTYIGFNLPPDVPLFAAVDGIFTTGNEGGNPFSGYDLFVRTASDSFTFKGNIRLTNRPTSQPVKAGEIIGYTQATGKKSLGKYDFVFTVGTAGATGPVTDEGKLKSIISNPFH